MDADTFESLNALLRGELAAVDSYNHALSHIKDQRLAQTLREGLQSHSHRVRLIRELISRSGLTPAEDAGPWGGFARLITDASSIAGDTALVTALEEGEDMGLTEYEWRLVGLPGEVHHFVRDKLLTEQMRTHKLLSGLANKSLGGIWPPVPERKEV